VSCKLGACLIQGDDGNAHFFTGLPWDVFLCLFHFLLPYTQGKTKDSLPFIDQLFVSLVRLHLDLSFELIAYLSGSKESTIRNYFWKWVNLMFTNLSFLVSWPDHNALKETIPPEFKQYFPKLTSIIDCFEIKIETPGNFLSRQKTYSNYKKHTTLKVLIACSPLGAVTFVSPAWGGRVSDVELVRNSGFISSSLHLPGSV
jgi:hypothetical protein